MRKLFCMKCSDCKFSYSFPCDNEYNQNGCGIEYDWKCLINGNVVGFEIDDNYAGDNEIDYQGCYWFNYIKSLLVKEKNNG